MCQYDKDWGASGRRPWSHNGYTTAAQRLPQHRGGRPGEPADYIGPMSESLSLRRLGNSGLAVSVVGLGTNNFGLKIDLEQSRAVVHAALDHGINLFDTSDSYGASEERLGEVLQGKRDDVLIATKFGSDVRRLGQDNGVDWGARGSRRYIRRAVENSLRRLRTDWIDLYQMHRPDPATPIEETLSALDDLVHEGKVRYLGHSNFSGWQTADAEWVARTRTIWSASSVRRTSTACSSARSRPTSCLRWRTIRSGCCRTSPWPVDCSPGSTGVANLLLTAAGFRPGSGSRSSPMPTSTCWRSSRPSPASVPSPCSTWR